MFDSIDKAADKVESAINVAAEAVGKGLVRISHLPHSASLIGPITLTVYSYQSLIPFPISHTLGPRD